jgi:hypothetical protein
MVISNHGADSLSPSSHTLASLVEQRTPTTRPTPKPKITRKIGMAFVMFGVNTNEANINAKTGLAKKVKRAIVLRLKPLSVTEKDLCKSATKR